MSMNHGMHFRCVSDILCSEDALLRDALLSAHLTLLTIYLRAETSPKNAEPSWSPFSAGSCHRCKALNSLVRGRCDSISIWILSGSNRTRQSSCQARAVTVKLTAI
uniref:Uncharacterized protein n=1 Tax=Haptolina brevifila TaxID=156173 RepID=A0A7S2JPL0_9EUKA|mmetsp:Transcript_8679/g.17651  ORF Transcript_8679/g.17651 Transcript_8679/m.17651 type:complete len:106 (+) Transcript_8679:134-451(+)